MRMPALQSSTASSRHTRFYLDFVYAYIYGVYNTEARMFVLHNEHVLLLSELHLFYVLLRTQLSPPAFDTAGPLPLYRREATKGGGGITPKNDEGKR